MPESHHHYGPSTLNSREICPGWVNNKSSDQTKADEGELMHKASETGDTSILPKPEQQAMVQMCLGYSYELEKGAIKVLKEVKMPIVYGLTFGTADRVIYRIKDGKKHVDVIDFKFGLWAVSAAETNKQGFSYLTGAYDLFPDAETVTIHFLQPRLDVVDTHDFTRDDIPKLKLAVSIIINRSKLYDETRDESLLNPTGEGCLFCGRHATCPKAIAYALGTAKKYAPLEIMDEVHSSQVTVPHTMAQMVDAARLLEKMASSIKTHAMALAEQHGGLFDADGKQVYEIAERAGTRKIKDLGLALPALSKHLTDRELLSIADVSLSQAVKLIAGKAPRGKKAAVVAEFEKEMQEADAIQSAEHGVRYLRRMRN